MKSQGLHLLLLAFTLLQACAGPRPIKDLVLTHAAIESAKQIEAHLLAPALWHQANTHYRQAMEHFKQKRYHKAQEAFILSRMFAEKAENKTRMKRFESGDMVP